MMLSLDTAYRSFGGEVEASSTPTICRLSDSRRHQLWAIAPGSKPLSLMVQFGELCNIQCIMCPQDHLSPVGISPESIERVKEAIPSIANMTLTGGEPTAFKQCWEIIEHFNLYASKQARIGILTNLKSVSKQRVERYFNNINYLGLGINVDAAKKATYEHIRRGANWEQF